MLPLYNFWQCSACACCTSWQCVSWASACINLQVSPDLLTARMPLLNVILVTLDVVQILASKVTTLTVRHTNRIWKHVCIVYLYSLSQVHRNL